MLSQCLAYYFSVWAKLVWFIGITFIKFCHPATVQDFEYSTSLQLLILLYCTTTERWRFGTFMFVVSLLVYMARSSKVISTLFYILYTLLPDNGWRELCASSCIIIFSQYIGIWMTMLNSRCECKLQSWDLFSWLE